MQADTSFSSLSRVCDRPRAEAEENDSDQSQEGGSIENCLDSEKSQRKSTCQRGQNRAKVQGTVKDAHGKPHTIQIPFLDKKG